MHGNDGEDWLNGDKGTDKLYAGKGGDTLKDTDIDVDILKGQGGGDLFMILNPGELVNTDFDLFQGDAILLTPF
jgi:hypothetical protein